MLLLSKISNLSPYSPDWFNHRIGMMTGSMIYNICAPKGIGEGGMTYIRNKVSEVITGKPVERNITTEATVWGIENEPISLKEWRLKNNIYDIKTDKHIIYDERYSVTPDGLVIRDEKFMFSQDGTELKCETVESKSYMTPSIHMKHVECKTPEEIKAINPQLFWQVISQIYWANVFVGHAIFFHPDFPEKSAYRLGHVEFRKINLMGEIKLFKARTEEAKKIFDSKLEYSNSETINELTNN